VCVREREIERESVCVKERGTSNFHWDQVSYENEKRRECVCVRERERYREGVCM